MTKKNSPNLGKAEWHIEYVNIRFTATSTAIPCVIDAGHIVDHILGKTADSSIMMELWNESLRDSYRKFQENFDPAPVLDLYGRELFDDTTR